MSKFVIVIDTQRDFLDPGGALPVPGADAIVAPMQQWLRSLDPADTAGVLFTYDSHEGDTFPNSPEAELFPIHCVRGTAGWQNLLDPSGLAAGIPRYRLEKGVFDMWAEPDVTVVDEGSGEATPREAFFQSLHEQGVHEVTVIGVAADYCVRWAVAGLVARGFSCKVPKALTRGIERQIEAVAAEEFPRTLQVIEHTDS